MDACLIAIGAIHVMFDITSAVFGGRALHRGKHCTRVAGQVMFTLGLLNASVQINTTDLVADICRQT